MPAIDTYLALRYVPQPETLFAVSVLPAAHFLRLQHGASHGAPVLGGPSAGRRVPQVTATTPRSSTACFIDAVQTHDAKRCSGRRLPQWRGGLQPGRGGHAPFTDRLKTFSIGFGSPMDETGPGRGARGASGLRAPEMYLRPGGLRAACLSAVWHLERPIGDALILAYFRLAEAASQHGKVVLSGEGADELFAGYSFHKIIRWTTFTTGGPGPLNRRVAVPLLAAPVDLLDRFFVYPAHLGRKGKAQDSRLPSRYYSGG